MVKRQKEKPATEPRNAVSLSFPVIQPKERLPCHVLLQNQIILIDNFLSAIECKAYTKFIDALPLKLTPAKKRGETERVNYRFSVTSTDFASKLLTSLLPHLPSLPPSASAKTKPSNLNNPRLPNSLNSNIRLYKYTASQHFGPHYDESVQDKLTGTKSEWTLLIYVTGQEDGVEGGQTLFYIQERNQPKQVITVPLTRGSILLHR
ncbi:hypothetical protein AX15_004977 [Amanita polypyramis BW_CC]|nr:hypothetical protein AX15_004977 [Amanita polypyramis BW_CC]